MREKPEDQAKKVMVEAMRRNFPDEANLSDDEVIRKHDLGEMIGLLTKYFVAIDGAWDTLEEATK